MASPSIKVTDDGLNLSIQPPILSASVTMAAVTQDESASKILVVGNDGQTHFRLLPPGGTAVASTPGASSNALVAYADGTGATLINSGVTASAGALTGVTSINGTPVPTSAGAAGGTFSTTWLSSSGFTLGPVNNAKIIWARAGNTIICTAWFDPPNPVGSNITSIAEFLLPVARPTPFTVDYQCTGTAQCQDARQNNGYFRSVNGSTNTAQLHMTAASSGPVLITGNFQYPLN